MTWKFVANLAALLSLGAMTACGAAEEAIELAQTGTGAVQVPSGGTALTGGITGSGGAVSGGVLLTGGSVGTGGLIGTGGFATTGGELAVTGGSVAGGAPTSGGAAATGGTQGGGLSPRGPAPTRDSAMKKGPYNVVSTTMGLRDGAEYGSQTLHYPTDAEPPYAYISIVPGFVSPESSIVNWGPFLASHGIVVLTIGTNTGGDPPEVRARALQDALETIRAEHTKAGGPLQGKLALDRFAIAGWSMGGGGATIVANTNSEPGLRAAMSFCGWQPGYQASTNKIPTLWFAALGDPLAGGQSQGFYDSTPATTPKILMEMPGGDHWIANDPAGYSNQVGLYGLSWMKVFLEGDDRYRQFLKMEPQGLTDWRSNGI